MPADSRLVNAASPGKLYTVPGSDGLWTWEAILAANINPETATDASGGSGDGSNGSGTGTGSNSGETGDGSNGSGTGEDGSTNNPIAYLFHSISKATQAQKGGNADGKEQTGGTSNLGLNPYGPSLPFKVPDFLAKYWKQFLIAAALFGGTIAVIDQQKGSRRR